MEKGETSLVSSSKAFLAEGKARRGEVVLALPNMEVAPIV
jgi:hypothetical protein